MPNLLIVESPGKIKKLQQILGPDWIIKASGGHIRELADDGDSSLGFDLIEHRVLCRFVPRKPRGAKTISELKTAARLATRTFLGCDPDREGEVIAWHLAEELRLTNPQRVTYAEITPTAVQQAIAHPRPLNLDLVHSGLCRSVLDKLVGYKGSPLIWQLQNGAKSMGRVQSATLHLICQREREIQEFVPQDYWNVFVEYGEGFRAFFQGHATTTEEHQLDDATSATSVERTTPESARVMPRTEADRLVAIAQQHSHQIIQIEGKIVSKSPPPPFITSSLQQAAGSRHDTTPEQTMQVAQSLYEKGLITYMRTDSIALSPDFQTQAKQWLEERDPGNVPKEPTQYGARKGAQEAHEAIRPTDVFLPSAQLKQELSREELDLYVLIWKRAIASQCKPAQIQQTTITTQSGPVNWQAEGRILQEAGYSKYWKNLQEDAQLPTLAQGQALTLKRAAHEKKRTAPPPRYSEPKLVQAMERLGIGRPSTYAPTIKTLKTRTYVRAQRAILHPTELGLGVDRFLQEALPDLLEPEFTAHMEETLDHIAQGDVEWQQWLTTWNRTYFVPALSNAQQVVPRHHSETPVAGETTPKKTKPSRSTRSTRGKKTALKSEGRSLSTTPCPQCQQKMYQVPRLTLEKQYFLGCNCGAVMFWSDVRQAWEQPRPRPELTEETEGRSQLSSKPIGKKQPQLHPDRGASDSKSAATPVGSTHPQGHKHDIR